MTGWADDAIDEEQEGEDRPTSDGDILGDVTISRRRANTITAPAPRWEVDREALASASSNKVCGARSRVRHHAYPPSRPAASSGKARRCTATG